MPRAGTYTDASGLGDETENARLTWEMCGDEADFDVDSESIVAWGITTGADIYCWLTTDEDPDRWPVLVCGRHTSPSFQVHPFGMAEFLRRLLGDAEFQEETISVTLPEERAFANWREQERRREARVNPVAGRPWYQAQLFTGLDSQGERLPYKGPTASAEALWPMGEPTYWREPGCPAPPTAGPPP
ncbi:hypothetical protein ACWY4P_17285 [Streptomyces sp. LZ34]